MVAAVGSFCDARAQRGVWQLRIDDLDPVRVAKGAASAILRTLQAFALEWDAEAVYQGERAAAYHAALHKLRQSGRVFACACSRKEVSNSGVVGLDDPIYPGTCRGGLPSGRPARALRLRVDEDSIGFDDALQGHVLQRLAREAGDFVLYRADRVFSYHLACVVDDAEQGVTHVVRGADLIDSTPRQILIQRLLRLPTPQYLHLPVALDTYGEKLSKQTLAQPVDARAPAATICAALRFLGQAPPAELARVPPRETLAWAVANWRRERLPRSRAAPVTEERSDQ